MRLPARFIAGNIVWTREATVWAVFRAEPASYPWLARHEKLRLHRRSRAALMALPGDSMVLSLCTPVPAVELSGRMANDGAQDEWAEIAGLAGRAAMELGPSERHTFLAAELAPHEDSRGLLPVMGSAAAAIAPAFGLPPQPVAGAEIERRMEQSAGLLARLQAAIDLRAATSSEICWIYERSLQRGQGSSPVAPPNHPSPAASGPRLTSIGDAVVKEGGITTDADRPAHRRYLRIQTESGVAYQALLALSDMPHHYEFPDGGGEWLAAAEALEFPVDWCLRIHPVPNGAAQASARRQARQLKAQVGEYEGDPAGTPPGLSEAMDALGDLREQLAANAGDNELQVTTVFAVASSRLRQLEDRVEALRSRYRAGEYGMHRPIGGQSGLFLSMLPGSQARPPAGDYRHHLLCRDLAAGMPFAGSGVGDPQGVLLGYCLDAGTFQPVFFDPAYGPTINRSASLGAFGALGSGKSYFMKNVVYATLARGGRVAVLDRTAGGEYVRLAPLAPGRAQVVRVGAGSSVCLDPLTVLSSGERVAVALGFLCLVTGAAPTEPPGLALAEAVHAVAARPGGRLADVLEALEEAAATDPAAASVGRMLRSACRNPLAGFAFGDRRSPEALLEADYLVFHAPGLNLPERDVALREHLARRLPPELVLSQAVLYLVAAVTRHVTFSDSRRFAAALFDEAWYLTASLQGRSLLLDGIRDGRKHNAAVWLVSQHPNDLGDDELAHLLGSRFVFRQAKGAAPAALRFAGIEPSERAVDLVESAGEGTCFLRDVRDRIGRVQILPAMTSELHAAFDTNPATEGSRPA